MYCHCQCDDAPDDTVLCSPLPVPVPQSWSGLRPLQTVGARAGLGRAGTGPGRGERERDQRYREQTLVEVSRLW